MLSIRKYNSLFDYIVWKSPPDDETVVIRNTSAQTVVIDSILVEFDADGYDEFSIAWVEGDPEKSAGRAGTEKPFRGAIRYRGNRKISLQMKSTD